MSDSELYYLSEEQKDAALNSSNDDCLVPTQYQGYRIRGLSNMTLENVERIAIFETLLLVQGNRTQAAKKLDISPKTMYNKIRLHKLSDYNFKRIQILEPTQEKLDD